MQIRIEDIKAFLTVADLKSFNRAAEELHITQSALSRRLKKLEGNLGARLLDRTTRSVNLTVVGNEFMPMARRMVRDFEKSISDIVDVIQIRDGVVSISSNMTIADTLLPEALIRFSVSHPNIRVRITEDSSPATVERVVLGEAEFGIGQVGQKRPDVDFEPLFQEPFVIVCHREHPLAFEKKLRWSDLREHSFIKMRSESGTFQLLRRALDPRGIELEEKYEVAHLSAMLSLIGKNLGISAIPGLGALKRPDLDLVIKPIDAPTVSRVLGIVKLKGRTLSPAAQALRETVREVFAETDDMAFATNLAKRTRKGGRQ